MSLYLSPGKEYLLNYSITSLNRHHMSSQILAL